MAVDYKRRSRRKKKRKPVPGWLWLVTGTASGLFVAFLLNISHPDQPVEPSYAKPEPTQEAQKAPEPEAAKPRPRFDFYTLLPEMEVVIPDRPTVKPNEMDETETANSSQDPNSEYLLQVGSFRHASDADALRAKLVLSGFDAHVISFKINNDQWNRVRLGPYASLAAAHQARAKLRDQDLDAMVLKAKQ